MDMFELVKVAISYGLQGGVSPRQHTLACWTIWYAGENPVDSRDLRMYIV